MHDKDIHELTPEQTPGDASLIHRQVHSEDWGRIVDSKQQAIDKMICFDTDTGLIPEINNAWLKTLEYESDQICGKNITETGVYCTRVDQADGDQRTIFAEILESTTKI